MDSIFRDFGIKLKRFLNIGFHPKVDLLVDIQTERFGKDYGGWNVALGLLDSNSIVYSFGIGTDVSFDLDLISKYGLTTYGFDPTPKSIDWINKQTFPPKFQIVPKGISSSDGAASFNPPDNPEHVSHTLLDKQPTAAASINCSFNRLSTLTQEFGHGKIDLLKIDIEDAEYDVITDILQSAVRPKQLVIEFHHRFPNVGIQKTKDCIQQIRDAGYKLFWSSNSLEEFGFIQTDTQLRQNC